MPAMLPLCCARDVQVIALEAQLGQFALEFAGLNAQVDQRAEEHVAADAADQIQIELFIRGLRSTRGR